MYIYTMQAKLGKAKFISTFIYNFCSELIVNAIIT